MNKRPIVISLREIGDEKDSDSSRRKRIARKAKPADCRKRSVYAEGKNRKSCPIGIKSNEKWSPRGGLIKSVREEGVQSSPSPDK